MAGLATDFGCFFGFVRSFDLGNLALLTMLIDSFDSSACTRLLLFSVDVLLPLSLPAVDSCCLSLSAGLLARLLFDPKMFCTKSSSPCMLTFSLETTTIAPLLRSDALALLEAGLLSTVTDLLASGEADSTTTATGTAVTELSGEISELESKSPPSEDRSVAVSGVSTLIRIGLSWC
uniref:(northern house mosquito) hypothetical protein n=1 Tax=Culex pipiens TaxID=7175 RepID=A0A8D8FE75_CULPI